MKYLFKRLFSILLLGFLLYSCIYHRMTHMSCEELKWVTNRYEGEVMYFKSQHGIIDTVTIVEIAIFNSLDPINWGYINTSNTEYIATAEIRYVINHNMGGSLYLEKQNNDEPIYLASIINRGWPEYIPLSTKSLRVNGVNMNDVMLFYNNDSTYTPQNAPDSFKSCAWSKKHGLVQYTFQDGTVFSRTDIAAIDPHK